jgi:glycosyltransferase involved in cell wall biosynthesis
MVAVEALSYGTPAVIPDTGGIVEAVRADGRTGALLFRSWDSGHLAEQIERLLKEPALHRQLSEAGPHVAAFHSVRRMTDGLLEHMGLPGQNPPLGPQGPRLSSRWDSGSQKEGPEGKSE